MVLTQSKLEEVLEKHKMAVREIYALGLSLGILDSEISETNDSVIYLADDYTFCVLPIAEPVPDGYFRITRALNVHCLSPVVIAHLYETAISRKRSWMVLQS